MSHTVRTLVCPPERVFAVLADGWLFPSWVVGASRMRSVEDGWPHVGSRLHHSFGIWPVLIDDETTALQWDPPHRFVIQPKGWPIGEARVAIDVEPHERGCVVHIREQAVTGPGAFVPVWMLDIGLHLRNVETLRRLAFLAEGAASGDALSRTDQATRADRATAPSPRRSWFAKTASLAVAVLPLVGLALHVRTRKHARLGGLRRTVAG